MIIFETILSKFDHGLWSCHLPIPHHIFEKIIRSKNKRVICTINNQLTIHSGLMPANGIWFIMLNKNTIKKLGLKVGNSVQVSLEVDNSEYGMPMSEEMLVCLNQDPEANQYFQALTPGKKRNLIYIVSKIKNSDIRINKSLAILFHLKEVKGNLDFKLLNETFKHMK